MEEKEVKVEEKTTAQKQPKKAEITISKDYVGTIASVLAVVLLLIMKICANFALVGGTLAGIMSIFIYGLAVAGIVINVLRQRRLSQEVWLSIAILALALIIW